MVLPQRIVSWALPVFLNSDASGSLGSFAPQEHNPGGEYKAKMIAYPYAEQAVSG